ncbi:E3 ubiquitin-protein ligase ATL31-like [Abeliophyllum distichum]|uniref:E3 ubiquitin-protein ligase ATL31-like n=1 Tax=Abeliophyllum distichum TaxID=126358 RepID=A0ABD1RVW8_9LAMI
MNRNSSFQYPNRPPRAWSVRRPKMFGLGLRVVRQHYLEKAVPKGVEGFTGGSKSQELEVKSDRWNFNRASSFFSRALSMRSPRVVAENGEASTSTGGRPPVKMPSFKCLEPKAADETHLVSADSAQPPV